ncbi:hypothetical protein AB0K89_25990 [Streptomyces cinnamoneus]|uniref:hypothetical protein n=1 Tax=Streptomyces cinnamoneus TaxID=53446 RepID=UPI00344A4A05
MSNPYDVSPHIAGTAPGRPRMFQTRLAQAAWTALPLVTLSLAAAVPFVVAAVRGVIKPRIAVVYAIAEVATLTFSVVTADPDGKNASPFAGLAIILLTITAATHTALLDQDKIRIGK